MQPGLRGGVGQAGEFFVCPGPFQRDGLGLLDRGGDGALQFASPRLQRALRKLRFLCLALKTALLLAAFGELAFGLDHPFIQLRMALLAVGQLHVQFLETAFGGDAALLQCFELRVDLRQVAFDLLTARTGLLGQLGQAQRLDLQFVRLGLRFGRFAPHQHQPLRRVRVGRLSPHQRGAGFFRDQVLGSQLLVQVFDFLLARQQAGLLGILRIEAHAVRGDRVAALHVNHFAGLQPVARRQRLFETGGREATVQPVRQQGLLAGVVQAQQVRQPWERSGRFRRGGRRRTVERQFGRRRVIAEGADQVQPRHL